MNTYIGNYEVHELHYTAQIKNKAGQYTCQQIKGFLYDDKVIQLIPANSEGISLTYYRHNVESFKLFPENGKAIKIF